MTRLALAGRRQEAEALLRDYARWYGADSVYAALQQNFLQGDTVRNRKLAGIAEEAGVRLVVTNDVHYHAAERYRLQNALVAIRLNTTVDQALPHLLPNNQFYLKPAGEMARLFAAFPEAVANTVEIAERCAFDLGTDLGYMLPKPALPEGYTAEGYLRELCYGAAVRRYGAVTKQITERLEEEFSLIGRHGLAGFLLLYREIVLIAQEIMVERGRPAEFEGREPPGRGRGSSVALLVGYLIGISHIDPLKWSLTLERFLSEDTTVLPDIDLDFPRALRDELIERVHERFGPEYAVLAGAIATYKIKGVLRDLGKALGLPQEELGLLSKQMRSHDAARIGEEMAQLPAFSQRVGACGWRELIELAPQLMGAPKLLSQHVGGMILSSSPIPEMVPVREGAMAGRFHHGLGQGQCGGRGFCEDRYSVAAGAGPVGGGAGFGGGAGGEAAGCEPDRSGGREGVRHDQCGAVEGDLSAAVAGAVEDGAALAVAQSAGPGVPGGADPAGGGGAGERGVAVCGTVQARGGVGVRSSAGGACAVAGIRCDRVAGAGCAADHGRVGADGGTGG